MTDSMIERVARALCKVDGFTHPDEDWRCSENGETTGVMLTVAIPAGQTQRWRTYSREARAAIEAMREPTEGMDKAGQEVTARGLFRCSSVWDAMIDAALKD